MPTPTEQKTVQAQTLTYAEATFYSTTNRLVKWLYSHATGAIMPNLNNGVMQRLPVFYPDPETQTAIIETFATIDQKLSTAVRRQTMLQDLFRTFLHELMTAKTRVHELDFPITVFDI